MPRASCDTFCRSLRCCALAFAAACSGCGDAPAEAPLADTQPLRSIREAPAVAFCEHVEPADAALDLIPLPPLDDAQSSAADDMSPPATAAEPEGPSLLPPMDLAALPFSEIAPEELPAAMELPPPAPAQEHAIESEAENPHITEAELLLADASPTATGSPTGAVVSERAQARIRRGYALAQRGASFAARSEFIQVLRMIAEAKDQKHGAPRRTIALANGLRALDEAVDFAPRGPAVDADLNLAVIISSHRTPVAKVPAAEKLLPQQLADLYVRYAQLQLGGSVAGEPAGSMALHALGKVYSQLGRTEPDASPMADRCAFALQQAALLARDDNHLAAHELGVLLAESGHYIESDHLLAQVAAKQPHPVVFRNWARVQRKLGREQLAAMSEQHAQALAARQGSGLVTWVPPQALAQKGDSLAPAAPPAQVAATPPRPRPRSHPAATAPTVHNVTRLPGGYLR
jgi:tetratricopeptide (TPR) repeat protein